MQKPDASGAIRQREQSMTISYFVFFENKHRLSDRVSEADNNGICDLIARTPGLLKAHVYTPAIIEGPFANDGPPPQFALQLYFGVLQDLEAVIASGGHLQALATPHAWPTLAGMVATQQAMTTRPFPVPLQRSETAADEPRCSYLVHYPGRAQDLNTWLKYYLSHHPQLMKHMPGIREIEIYTRVDWCDSMPWERVCHMQRNKLVFDSPSALAAALTSPALHDMRADFNRFPRFVGGNVHHPMITRTIVV
jgi:hypothetical protein